MDAPAGRLTLRERREIAAGLEGGRSYSAIARALGRTTSTVSREVVRNGGPSRYLADHAQATAQRRARRTPAPAAASRAGDQALDPARGFVERFAALLAESGLSRMASRVLASLLVEDSGALTAAQLTARLRVSPASVSKAVGYLERLGLVSRERSADSRREWYSIEEDLWLRSWRTSAQRNTDWGAAAAEGAAILGAGTPAGRRLATTARFFARLGSEIAATGDRRAAVEDALTLLAVVLHTPTRPVAEALATTLAWPQERVDAALVEASADRVPALPEDGHPH